MGNRFSHHRTYDLKPCKIIQPNIFYNFAEIAYIAYISYIHN